MKVSLGLPTAHQLDQFLTRKKDLSPSYAEKFDTQDDFREKKNTLLATKYDYDENTVLLGTGPAVFAAAKAAIERWQMFPAGWTKVYPDQAPIQSGQQVAVLFKLLGIWWWNSNAIQYTVDEARKFGFAYGTLPGHAESGEELFLIEMDEREKVWYQIKAFSRPAYWFVHLAYPFARSQQRRFVRESMRKMKALAQQKHSHV